MLLLVSAVGILAAHVWSEVVSDSGLPDAPQAQVPAEQLLPGQPLPGSIHGVVVDRDGAVYQGARVELARTASNPPVIQTAISDSDGRFNFAGVPPGAFNLTVSSNGFATKLVSGVLHPGESYEAQPIVLAVTTASTDVQVTASQQEIAQAQLKVEEQQRVLGVVPNFYVTYLPNAAPLTPRQKFQLAWRSSIDPVTIGISGAFAGVEQADNIFPGYGQGAQGYAKRFGANYADTVIGTVIGSAILPSVLKQDPRYFYKGTGSIRSRAFYAIANAVICKGDNGKWEPNYSGILGGLAAGGISNLYYPASNTSGVTLTFENALVGTAETAVQNLFQEFVVRKLTPKVPNYSTSK